MANPPPSGPYHPPGAYPPPYYGAYPPPPPHFPPHPPHFPPPPGHQPPGPPPAHYYVPGAVVMPYPMYPPAHPTPEASAPAQPPTYVTNHYYNAAPESAPTPAQEMAPEVKVAEVTPRDAGVVPPTNPACWRVGCDPPPYNDSENRLAGIEWVPATNTTSRYLEGRSVVAGHEGWDGSPLWVIRATHNGDLVPGKLSVRHNVAYIPYSGKEITVQNIEVLCAPPSIIRWIPSGNGQVPNGAIPGGRTASGETLYIGRARYQLSLTPGKIHQSHQTCYISFGGNEVSHKMYDVLCRV